MKNEDNSNKRKSIRGDISSLKTTKSLCEIYENKDEVLYERYLSEFVGVYLTLFTLGLGDEWHKWQIEHEDEE